jgi:hypothetical protein
MRWEQKQNAALARQTISQQCRARHQVGQATQSETTYLGRALPAAENYLALVERRSEPNRMNRDLSTPMLGRAATWTPIDL